MKKIFTFECDCGDITNDHVTKVWVDKEEDDVCIYSSLNHYLPWYKRVLPAIKYLLGVDNTFIHYKETFMSIDNFNKQLEKISTYSNKEE